MAKGCRSEVVKDIVDYGVLGFLLFLSVVMLGVVFERLWVYHKIDVAHFEDKRILELLLHMLAEEGEEKTFRYIKRYIL